MKNQNLLKLLTIMSIVFIIGNVIAGFIGTKAAILVPFLGISLGIFVFTHGIAHFGIKKVLILIGIGMIVSFFYEALSIATGFPYGAYHYTEVFGPKLMGFPILVMFAYGLVAYVFWVVAKSLVGNYSNKIKGANIVFIPLIASALLTSWDYVLDPIFASINKAYIWHYPGSYFGIPFSNFLGWYLAAYTMFQIFALVIYLQKKQKVPDIMRKKSYWYLPIVFYAGVFIQLFLTMVLQPNEEITIFSGQVFQTSYIYQSMTLVGIAAILVPAIIAFANVLTSKTLK